MRSAHDRLAGSGTLIYRIRTTEPLTCGNSIDLSKSRPWSVSQKSLGSKKAAERSLTQRASCCQKESPSMPQNKVDFAIQDVESILVIKLDRVGDFVLASPFLRGLRASAPKARIDLVVTPEAFPVAEHCPYVD